MLDKPLVLVINALAVVCFLVVIFFEFQEALTYCGGLGGLF